MNIPINITHDPQDEEDEDKWTAFNIIDKYDIEENYYIEIEDPLNLLPNPGYLENIFIKFKEEDNEKVATAGTHQIFGTQNFENSDSDSDDSKTQFIFYPLPRPPL